MNNSPVCSTRIREHLGDHVLFRALCVPEDNEKYPKEGKHGVNNERENRKGKLSLVMEEWRVE